jgi:chromosome segregation ATPase
MASQVNLAPFSSPLAGSPYPANHKLGRVGGSLLAMVLLCLVAILGQAIGLYSLIRHGSEREGWNAQKAQFANVQSEWEKVTNSASIEVKELDQKRSALLLEIKKLDEDRKRNAEEAAKVKGQLDSFTQSREETLTLQRRAQEQQQLALDAESAAKARTAELATAKENLERDLEQLKTESMALQKAAQAAKTTSEQQAAAIAKQTQELAEMDKRLASGREEVRKQNADLIKASEDLAKALSGKQAALAATTAAADESERVSKLQDELAKLTGVVAALKSEKETTQSDLAKEETRLQNAKLRLADYLEQWKTRETILKDLSTLQTDLASLKTNKATAEQELQGLKDQLTKATVDASTKSKEVTEIQARVEELRKEEARLAAALLERVKSLKATDAKEGTPD